MKPPMVATPTMAATRRQVDLGVAILGQCVLPIECATAAGVTHDFFCGARSQIRQQNDSATVYYKQKYFTVHDARSAAI